MDDPSGSENRNDGSNEDNIPVAKFICFDFCCYERIGWDVTAAGFACPIPYATAAKVDVPEGFPNIPERWTHSKVQLSAEGLYEVANILERYISRIDQNNRRLALDSYQEVLKSLESKLDTLYKDISDHPMAASRQTTSIEKRLGDIIEFCEDTTYELEAIIGLIQLFEDTCPLHLEPSVERIGILMTFNHFNYEQNYNLNFVMAHWLRNNWILPYTYIYQVNYLSYTYGFDPIVIQAWVQNAISIVWKPTFDLSGSLRNYLEILLLKRSSSERTKDIAKATDGRQYSTTTLMPMVETMSI